MIKQTHQGRLSGMEAVIFNQYNYVHNMVGFHILPTSIVVDVKSYDGVHASRVTFLGIHETALEHGRWQIVFASIAADGGRMKPDFSYNLYVPPAARERLLTTLQAMCAPDDAAALTELQRDATRTDVDFSLVLPPEPSIRQFADWYPGPYRWDSHGMVRVGMIAAWLKPEPVPAWLEPRSRADDVTLCLRVWPVTSTVQVSCVQAPSFWHSLIRLLETADGRWGLLDDSSGGPELPFWSHTAGRIPMSIPVW